MVTHLLDDGHRHLLLITLQRCCHNIWSLAHFSEPLSTSYLMGLGDRRQMKVGVQGGQTEGAQSCMDEGRALFACSLYVDGAC